LPQISPSAIAEAIRQALLDAADKPTNPAMAGLRLDLPDDLRLMLAPSRSL
jgi:hypothetical protein